MEPEKIDKVLFKLAEYTYCKDFDILMDELYGNSFQYNERQELKKHHLQHGLIKYDDIEQVYELTEKGYSIVNENKGYGNFLKQKKKEKRYFNYEFFVKYILPIAGIIFTILSYFHCNK